MQIIIANMGVALGEVGALEDESNFNHFDQCENTKLIMIGQNGKGGLFGDDTSNLM